VNLPEFTNKKKNPAARILVAGFVVALLGGGAAFLASQHSPTPDERATAITAQVADDVVTVISGNDNDGAANARIKAVVDDFNKNSGCKFIGGTVTGGGTVKEATAAANKLIYTARNAPAASQMGDKLGMGYTVVGTGGLIRGIDFVAIVVAVDCTPVQTGPTGLGS
jgi:hypothetical protein